MRRRPVRRRLTVCACALAAAAAMGVLSAPAASADPVRGTQVLHHLSNATSSNAPNRMDVPWLGRKWG